MRFSILALCLLAPLALCRAEDSRHPVALRAIAETDSSEVHPDSIFEVTLTLENPTDSVQKIKIPERGWDRVWRSSNRRVTWDPWSTDYDNQITVEIPPHGKYTFPRPLRMFVDESVKRSRIDFRMGLKMTAFGKTFWSAPITLEVYP